MDAPAAARDIPRPGTCSMGFHFAAVVWTYGTPLVPRHICAVHIARAVEQAWRDYTVRRFRGLTE